MYAFAYTIDYTNKLERIVLVGYTYTKSVRGVVGENIKQKRRFDRAGFKKKSFKALAILLVLVLLVSGGIALRNKYNQTHQCNGKQDSPIYSEAAANLTQTRYRELEKTIEKIKRQAGYTGDANCLYPIVTYYVMVGNIDGATATFADLEKAYKKDKGFVNVYAPRVTKIEDVKAQIDAMYKVKEQFDRNRTYL